jgi:hypothetical protein
MNGNKNANGIPTRSGNVNDTTIQNGGVDLSTIGWGPLLASTLIQNYLKICKKVIDGF